ncbi:putative nucleic acid-binding protein [Inquilinus ginsengisoli]|uniref:PIN domain-containing protein n=1 Tax=Inquilinus ginsengisoli TaxID=363840 RepID=UPI003D1E1861
MSRRFSIDANILFYAMDQTDPVKHRRATDIVDRSADADCVMTLQVLGEFFHSSSRKRPRERTVMAEQTRDWLELFPVVSSTPKLLPQALQLAEQGQVSFWDAMLVATVAEAGCTTLLSEDMADGVALGGVTVRNPFRGDRLPDEIEALLTV